MTKKSEIAFRVRPYLEPGEEVGEVFLAQARTPYLCILVPLFGYTIGVVVYLLLPEVGNQLCYWLSYCLFKLFGYGIILLMPLLLCGFVAAYILLWRTLTYHVIGSRIVVVTSQNMIVLRAQGRWPAFPTGTRPLARLPVQTRFGKRLLWHWTALEGEHLWIAGRPRQDVAQVGPRARARYCLSRVTHCCLAS